MTVLVAGVLRGARAEQMREWFGYSPSRRRRSQAPAVLTGDTGHRLEIAIAGLRGSSCRRVTCLQGLDGATPRERTRRNLTSRVEAGARKATLEQVQGTLIAGKQRGTSAYPDAATSVDCAGADAQHRLSFGERSQQEHRGGQQSGAATREPATSRTRSRRQRLHRRLHWLTGGHVAQLDVPAGRDVTAS